MHRGEQLAWQDHPVLPYTSINGRLYPPSFQIRIKNTSLRPLWFSLIFLGVEFEITNQLLPKTYLAPEQETWATFKEEDFDSRTIPLLIQDKFLERGIYRVHDYLKIFVSTAEFSTDVLNQEGLSKIYREIPTKRPGRRRRRIELLDWTCFDIALEVVHPQ